MNHIRLNILHVLDSSWEWIMGYVISGTDYELPPTDVFMTVCVQGWDKVGRGVAAKHSRS